MVEWDIEAREIGMATMGYGVHGEVAMDDHMAAARRGRPASAKALAEWTTSQKVSTLYRIWCAATTAEPEAFAACAHVPAMAKAALDGLEEAVPGRRTAVLAETLDNAIGRGEVHLIPWLLDLGAPACPCLGRVGRSGTQAQAIASFLKGEGRDGLASVSWCALAAQSGRMDSLYALEEAGVGAKDRSELWEGLLGRYASRESAVQAMATAHPWVLAAGKEERNGGKISSAKTQELSDLWEPKDQAERLACLDALALRSIEMWSSNGLSVLSKRGHKVAKELCATLCSTIASTTIFAGNGSKESGRYAKAAMDWCASGGGPTSGAVIVELCENASGMENGKTLQHARHSLESALQGLALFGKISQKRGAWSRVDPLEASKAASLLAVHAASGYVKESNRPALDAALAALDKMSGPHAPKRSKVLRM